MQDVFLAEDTVYIPFEDQREEYIQSDFGLLFMGSETNTVGRPWSFDQVRKKLNTKQLKKKVLPEDVPFKWGIIYECIMFYQSA